MRSHLLTPEDHWWLRLCSPAWDDPFDATWAPHRGARWTPPGTWPTLYFNRDLATARRQLLRLTEGTAAEPDDLAGDAYELVAARLPAGQVVCDVVTASGIAAVGLGPGYPTGRDGHRTAHQTCWPVATRAHEAGLDGVEARSAATLDGAGRELAWWPGTHRVEAIGERVALEAWRSPDVVDPSALFAA